MEAILILISLVGLAALAPRYGVDSRAHFRAKEEALAAHGMSWVDRPGRSGPAGSSD